MTRADQVLDADTGTWTLVTKPKIREGKTEVFRARFRRESPTQVKVHWVSDENRVDAVDSRNLALPSTGDMFYGGVFVQSQYGIKPGEAGISGETGVFHDSHEGYQLKMKVGAAWKSPGVDPRTLSLGVGEPTLKAGMGLKFGYYDGLGSAIEGPDVSWRLGPVTGGLYLTDGTLSGGDIACCQLKIGVPSKKGNPWVGWDSGANVRGPDLASEGWEHWGMRRDPLPDAPPVQPVEDAVNVE